MHRRHFLLGLTSLPFSVGLSKATEAKSAGTIFRISWRDIDVGYSSLNLVRNGTNLVANIDVKINVSILGLKLYSYSLECQEIWKNKELVGLKSEVLIGKTREYSKVSKTSKGFEIDGSSFAGVITGNPATTSYFTPDFLKRNIWISTQNGKPLKVQSKRIGLKEINTPRGVINATNWEVRGDLNINLFYDENDEWVSSKFRAGGADATFILNKKFGRNHKIWTQS